MDAETAYLFRHGMLRDTAYELMPPSTRESLHGLAGTSLSVLFAQRLEPVAGEIAYHFAKAGEQHADDELHHRVMAGLHAERNYAHEEAVVHFERVAGNPAWTDADRITASEYLIQILDQTGQSDQVEAALNRMKELAGDDPELQLRWESSRVRVDMRRGKSEQAAETFMKLAEAYAQRGDSRRELVALGNLSIIRKTQGRLDEAGQLGQRCLEISLALGDRAEECRTLANLATLHGFREDYAAAEEHSLRALKLAREIHDRMIEGAVLNALAVIYRRQGRHEDAERTYIEALAILREIGAKAHEAVALGNLGSVVDDMKRHEEAAALFKQAIGLHRQVGNRRFEGIHLGALAITLKRLGREGVEEMIDDAIGIVEEVGDTNMAESFRDIRARW